MRRAPRAETERFWAERSRAEVLEAAAEGALQARGRLSGERPQPAPAASFCLSLQLAVRPPRRAQRREASLSPKGLWERRKQKGGPLGRRHRAFIVLSGSCSSHEHRQHRRLRREQKQIRRSHAPSAPVRPPPRPRRRRARPRGRGRVMSRQEFDPRKLRQSGKVSAE